MNFDGTNVDLYYLQTREYIFGFSEISIFPNIYTFLILYSSNFFRFSLNYCDVDDSCIKMSSYSRFEVRNVQGLKMFYL